MSLHQTLNRHAPRAYICWWCMGSIQPEYVSTDGVSQRWYHPDCLDAYRRDMEEVDLDTDGDGEEDGNW